MKQCLIAFFLLITAVQIYAQDYYLPINREWSLRYEPVLNALDVNTHTSIKPYRNVQITSVSNFDSLNTFKLKPNNFNKTLAGKKLRSENLFIIKEDDFEDRCSICLESVNCADEISCSTCNSQVHSKCLLEYAENQNKNIYWYCDILVYYRKSFPWSTKKPSWRLTCCARYIRKRKG